MRKTLLAFLIVFVVEQIHVETLKRDFYYQKQSLIEEIFALIENDNLNDLTTTKKPKISEPTADDLDLDLLNSLNELEIQQMPKINDYSDEKTARDWLNWYFRISKRYHQVKHHEFRLRHVFLSFVFK